MTFGRSVTQPLLYSPKGSLTILFLHNPRLPMDVACIIIDPSVLTLMLC